MEQYKVTNENNEVIKILNADELADFQTSFTGSFYNLDLITE
jgi:hypothetical protein